MDASENLQGFAGDPNHNMHPDAYNNSIITPGSYTFLTGALDQAPLKDQPGGSLLQQAPPVSHEDGSEPSSSPSGSLIGTLFTNNQLAGSFNASRSPTLANSSNSWELTINGGRSGSSLYAGGSNMSNILMNGSGMMTGNSTPTAQLLINGLQGGSFNDNGQGDVYYPPSQGHNPHAEAMQVIYVNGSYSAFHPDGRGGSNATTLLYSSQDGAENNNNSTQQSPYGVSFLTPGTMSQRALEAAGAIPVMSLNQERHGSQSYHNWQRTGGNEHSFLPVNEEHQTHQSLFGAALGRQGGDQDHDLSHMHGEHLQSEVGMHVDPQSQGGNSNISVNGQGLLSLSLSSHQPHFQGGQLPGESTSEAHMVAQAAALAKTKELASRYLASSGANTDLSRFRTPSRDDVMGPRYHQENHAGNSARKLPSGLSSSSNALTSSKFLQSVQSVLNELCRVSPMKRTPKPATSAEQHNALRSSSASVHASYVYHGKEDSHADAGTGRGDLASSMSSLSDASHLVTVSHVPLQAEMMSDAARASGTSRDDLDFKKGQLVRMLDEVEARFRRYSEQLQVTCAGFNAQAGAHAATPYTILALQAMSRHFRCLKDAVKIQLKVVRRALGEEEISAGFNGETSRLRYVDQQIRQQRALQQLGMLQQHAWRPQRGLPERAVSVLRAWLFEHFLHPYPKDVDKMSLAKQTGLTRSQVSNWFINARVRLWKPMVEEMYVEEQREAADLVMQSDRMAREQVMHNSPYEPYEGTSRGRSTSSLQDELNNINGQHSGMPNDFRCTADDGREHDQAGPSVNNITEVQQSQVLFRQQDIAAAEHSFNFENTREAKRSKTALETVSDAFNNTSMLIMHTPDSENNAKFPSSSSTNDDTDLEARKLKGKCVAEHEHEQEPYVSGAFVSYHDGNNMNHVHRYETVTGFGAPRVAPTAGTGVSLTLGLRHCDANMRPSAGSVAPILEKYDMDVDIARMDPLDREAYLHEGRVREITADGQYEMQRDQQEENTSNLTREILPGGTGMANPAFEHHHEFNDDH